MSAADDKRMDEAALSAVLQRAGAGDAKAFDAVYRHFHPRVLGLCRYLLGSRTEAEDAASGVFARLPKAMKSYDASLPFPRWLDAPKKVVFSSCFRCAVDPGSALDPFHHAGHQT